MSSSAKDWKSERRPKDAEPPLDGPAACPLPSGDEPDPAARKAWEAALREGRCLHCEGELGKGWREEDGPFCCRGCRGVYELIHGQGLTRYYDLRQGPQAPAPSLRPESFTWLDRILDDTPDEEEVLHLNLEIQGVHCAACVWLLEELFEREEGGLELRINPSLGKVDLSWDRSRGDLRDYLAEVERFGYRLGPAQDGEAPRSRGLLFRLAFSVAMALNVMMFSISYYFGLAPEDGRLFDFFGHLNLALATASLLVGGPVFFRGALAGLRRRVAHLDLPISLGMILAYGGSLFAYLSAGPRAAYFDSLTAFIALMLLGRWGQERIIERNRNALLSSSGAEQLMVKRQLDGRLEAVAATEVRVGDELWIAPGDLLPAQGILLRRSAEASLDWITGESDQIAYQPGDRVPAGAFNAGRQGFSVAAAEDFADSRLGDLLRSGDGEEAFRPTWWHRVSSYYVMAVLLLSAAAFLLWVGRDLRTALEVTISVLVITCPCALGLAAPLAEELVHFALRQRGVFLRKATFLEKALRVRKVLLDKTGTLTLGHLTLEPESRRKLWALSAGNKQVLWNLCARSNHPVSRSLTEALGAGRDLPESEELLLDPAGDTLEELAGRGLRWRKGDVEFRLGRPDFAGGGGETARETRFTRDGELIAAFSFRETYKSDAAEELANLQGRGYELHLLSGDHPDKVDLAREALGIPAENALGGLDPEDKAARVRELDAGDTLMVGDGINDSPSFEAALCAATPAVDRPVLPGKADFYFLGDGVAAIRRALSAASRLRRVVRDNLAFAVVYNLMAVGLCFAGFVTPVVAAILMPLSSVLVVSLTAWRLSGRRLAWIS